MFPRLSAGVTAVMLCLALMLLPLAAVMMAQAQGPVLDAPAVLDRMEEAGRTQQASLNVWTGTRVYHAGNKRLGKSVSVTVQVDYTPPGQKSFRVLEQVGSGIIAKLAVFPALEAERRNAAPAIRASTDIARSNYEFHLLGFDPEVHAYIFEVLPRTRNRYRFRGRIWVDADTFGIRRIEGEPSVSPSRWIKRTNFTHEYARFGGYWLPVGHRSRAELHLFGTSTLEIDYREYSLNGETTLIHPGGQSSDPPESRAGPAGIPRDR